MLVRHNIQFIADKGDSTKISAGASGLLVSPSGPSFYSQWLNNTKSSCTRDTLSSECVTIREWGTGSDRLSPEERLKLACQTACLAAVFTVCPDTDSLPRSVQPLRAEQSPGIVHLLHV